MKNNIALLLSGFSLISISSAQVGLDPWGSQSSTAVGDRLFGPGSTVSTNHSFGPEGGGAGVLTSQSSFSEARGSSFGFSALDSTSGISVPTLKTYASTNGFDAYAAGGSVTVEGYLYTGPSTRTFNLDVDLTGTVSNMDNNFSGNFAVFSLWSEAIVGGDPFFFSTDAGSYLEFGFDNLDTLRLEQNGLNGDDVASGTLVWQMDPGDVVYLHANAFSRVYGPNSTADARNTVTSSFQDPTGLVSLSGGTSIPEPSTSLLGFLGVFALLRRKR